MLINFIILSLGSVIMNTLKRASYISRFKPRSSHFAGPGRVYLAVKISGRSIFTWLVGGEGDTCDVSAWSPLP